MSSISFKDNSPEFLKELSNRVDKILEAVGIHLEGEAKEELENTPRRIDTGLLRNSITHAVSGEPPAIRSYHASYANERYSKGKKAGQRRTAGSRAYGGSVNMGYYNGTAPTDPDNAKAVYIGSNVQYAGYVHEGTSRMSPNRYLKNACTRNAEQIKKYIKKGLKGQ